MGVIRDSDIASFQKHAGLEPARGQQCELLRSMQRVAFDLIKALELEISGIRDGDGYWGGCDPVHETVFELDTLERKRLEPATRRLREQCDAATGRGTGSLLFSVPISVDEK